MQISLQFRLPETKHFNCRYDEFTILLQDLLYPFLLSTATARCCTDSDRAMASHLGRQRKKCYLSVLKARLINPRHVRSRPPPFLKDLGVRVLPENWTPAILSHFCACLFHWTNFFLLVFPGHFTAAFQKQPEYLTSRTGSSRSPLSQRPAD